MTAQFPSFDRPAGRFSASSGRQSANAYTAFAGAIFASKLAKRAHTLEEDLVFRTRVRADKSVAARNFLTEFVLYLLFLFIFLFTLVAYRPNTAFQSAELVRRHLIDFSPTGIRNGDDVHVDTFSDIESVPEIFEWMSNVLVPTLFPNKEEPYSSHFFSSQFRVIGPLRLRQVRQRSDSKVSHVPQFRDQAGGVLPGCLQENAKNQKTSDTNSDTDSFGILPITELLSLSLDNTTIPCLPDQCSSCRTLFPSRPIVAVRITLLDDSISLTSSIRRVATAVITSTTGNIIFGTETDLSCNPVGSQVNFASPVTPYSIQLRFHDARDLHTAWSIDISSDGSTWYTLAIVGSGSIGSTLSTLAG